MDMMPTIRVVLMLLGVVCGARAQILQCNATTQSQDSLARWSLTTTGLTFSRDSHAAAVFDGKIWIVGGVSTTYYTKRLERTTTRSDIVYTSDGETWTEVFEEAPFRRRYGHTLTTFTDGSDKKERLVLLGGFSPEPATDVWTSTDGTVWTESAAAVSWVGRGYHCTVVFNNRLWIMGGSPLNNDVWSTSSVLNGGWTQQADVPWSPRAAHACTAHKVVGNVTIGETTIEEFVFLTGGWDETSLQDVWRMNKAGEWKQLLPIAPWKRRAWHSLVSFDSRTRGDIVLGPRLWLIGGGIIGKGVEKMFPYTDTWYTRDGVTWEQSSSDASGVSTAEWSMISTRDKQICMGKWGHVVVPFYRMVKRSFYCGATCQDETNTTSVANQIIPMCRPALDLPSPPVKRTVMVQNTVVLKTLYPDGCGYCNGTDADRYVNNTKVPALYLIAGNVGTQKVKDVFVSNDAMLCEHNGVICSNKGTCTLGGTCLCVNGKTGQFCDGDLGYIVLDDGACFPESAQVLTRDRGLQRIADVSVGDSVLAMEADGTPVFSDVYYIPLDSDPRVQTQFLRVHHQSLRDGQRLPPLELTPAHLVYTQPNDSVRFEVKPARELLLDDRLIILPFDATSSASASRVVALEMVARRGPTTLYTMTGTVVVDGVVCSNFADLYPRLTPTQSRDAVPFALFTPHRVLFRLVPHAATAQWLRRLMHHVILPLWQVVGY
ncbi:hypothetical protein Poli38472_000487 [Pythium oligandrum]|uniref:EGF-like domain-containing protein n=1 Tax=Pythium oligandrum TaxID=41045 RepID=A0A8K1CC78_PYTOL|nr:hypothetical protein Poli38472_000487 [Pythium oligandrum]|eukprot:TMW60445.1 hypothetical protein Poli38472_000487 [Pythium oligandrum]